MEKNRVLIADDSKLNRELLSAILGNEYDYIYANDGAEVIELLNNNIFVDIILLDVNMPKMGGFEVLSFLNEKHYIEEIPVVIISSENDVEFVRKAYSLGATDYISRPFNSIVVQHRVKNTLMIYSNQKRLVKLVEKQIYERERISNAMINIFSNIIELRNYESGSHTLHVQTITNLLLHELIKIDKNYHLSEEDISLISSLSALHDIGKIKIPENILNKPGKLNDDEWELMKTHTIEGYKILCQANIEQENNFINTAKEICRWHHEKYDGKGYPDGLKGNQIPISAQVVSMADVYDALTSKRCYKQSFTHEEAINMILNGECGIFNPSLIQCLKSISKQLKETLEVGVSTYDYHKESLHMIDEILANNKLSSTYHWFEIEKEKREFFEKESSKGIQFEYDMLSHKLKVLNNYENSEKKSHIFYGTNSDIKLLSEYDLKKLEEKIQHTTKENRMVSMNVLIPVDNVYRWHNLKAITLWPENSNSYTIVLGQFNDIHEEVINSGLDLIFPNSKIKEILDSLKSIFPVVRIVNPKNSKVLQVTEKGQIFETPSKCYEIWKRNQCCENCSSYTALNKKNWVSKLEVKDGQIYAVLSKYLKVKEKECVLEIAFCVDDEGKKSNNRCRLMSSHLFFDFYHDALTKTFTRTYLEDFSDNLEKVDGVAIIDVDDFKKINDTYGHPIGDVALEKIASVVMKILGKENITIRYGGDEFLLIFPKITKENLKETLLKIKNEVSKIEIESYDNIKLSVSIGGAYHIYPMSEAITYADREMYRNKLNK